MDVVPVDPAPSAACSDAELLRSVVVSEVAFRQFYDRHVRGVRRFLRAQVGDDLAEDLTAETFLVVLRRAGEYRSTAATARPWLLGIATNLARRSRRTSTRRERLLARMGRPDDRYEDRSIDRLSMGEDRTPMRSAVSRLARADREVLLLVALGELSYEEVATTLGIRVGTVRSRLPPRPHTGTHRARGRTGMNDLVDTALRSEFADHDDDESFVERIWTEVESRGVPADRREALHSAGVGEQEGAASPASLRLSSHASRSQVVRSPR